MLRNITAWNRSLASPRNPFDVLPRGNSFSFSVSFLTAKSRHHPCSLLKASNPSLHHCRHCRFAFRSQCASRVSTRRRIAHSIQPARRHHARNITNHRRFHVRPCRTYQHTNDPTDSRRISLVEVVLRITWGGGLREFGNKTLGARGVGALRCCCFSLLSHLDLGAHCRMARGAV